MFVADLAGIQAIADQLSQLGDAFQALHGEYNKLLEKIIAEAWTVGIAKDNYSIKYTENFHEITKAIAFCKNQAEFLKQYCEVHDEMDKDFGQAMSS